MKQQRQRGNTQKGKRGEDAAARFLSDNGFALIARNYKTHAGEIDIIAKDACGVIVFIEVKARFNENFGRPCESVGAVKQRRIKNAALAYLFAVGAPCGECRFDIIEIDLRDLSAEHIINAF